MSKNVPASNLPKIKADHPPTIKIRNIWTVIEDLPEQTCLNAKSGKEENIVNRILFDELAYSVPDAFFIQQNNPRWDWDGKTHLYKRPRIAQNRGSFLTGLVAKAVHVIYQVCDVIPIIIDERDRPEKTISLNWNYDKFKLRPYQQEVVENSIQKSRGVLEVATGGGKCCNENTLIPTAKGLLPISHFACDKLLDQNAKEINVFLQTERGICSTSYIYNDGESDSINVITKQGYEITGTSAHRILVVGKNGIPIYKKLSHIEKNDIALIHRGNSCFGNETILSEDDAYFLGIIFRDGGLTYLNKLVLTSGDNHIIEFYTSYLESNGFSYRKEDNSPNSINIISKKDSRCFLVSKFGILGTCKSTNKKWPLSILKSTENLISKFVRGLYETDGWVDERGRVCIGLSNQFFIANLQTVLLQFGIICSKRTKKTKKEDSHILIISSQKDRNLFSIKIGFDPTGHKKKKLESTLLNSKKSNTNVDLAYNLSNKMKIFYHSIRKNDDDINFLNEFCLRRYGIRYKTIKSYFGNISKRNPSIDVASKILQDANLEEYEKWYNGDYFFSPIKYIKKVTSHNYDFEVPETNSFIGNGFINHNTILASKLIQQLGITPFVFYVMSKELLYQSKIRLEESIPGLEVGVVGDGICNIRDINVVTIQTAIRVFGETVSEKEIKAMDVDDSFLKEFRKENMSHLDERRANIQEMIQNAKGIYFDEVHHCPAQTCKSVLMKSNNCYYMFGGSATPTRSDNADLMIEGLFGRKVCSVTASFLIKLGFLMKPKIFFVRLKEEASRSLNFQQDYKNNIVENDERNAHIVSIAQELASQDLSVLILVTRIDHGNLLEAAIPNSKFIHGSSGKKKRKKVLEELENKETKIVVATTIADEGLDIPTLNCVIIAGGGKSPTKTLQRVGRAIRKTPDKLCSIIIDFMDVGKYLKAHSSARKRLLRAEPEFVIKEVDEYNENPKMKVLF